MKQDEDTDIPVRAGSSPSPSPPSSLTPAPAPAICPVGTHVLADIHGVNAARLCDVDMLQMLLIAAARHANATVLGAHFRHFGGKHGVTGVVLLGESHITIHTWPEYRFAALDVFMCGKSRSDDAVQYVAQALCAERVECSAHLRGG